MMMNIGAMGCRLDAEGRAFEESIVFLVRRDLTPATTRME